MAAARRPATVLPPASARRMHDLTALLGRAHAVYEELIDELQEHDEVIAELIARVHREGVDDAGR